MQNNLRAMFENSTFSISSEPYFYCQAKEYPKDFSAHFMLTSDREEITIVTNNPDDSIIKEKDPNRWLLVSLNLATPFMKGTLFNISKAIYESDSNVLIVSTYSKDLLFIKEQDRDKVKTALIKLGFAYIKN